MARVKKKSNKTWGGIFPVKSTFLLITFILLASLGDTVIIIFIKSFFYIRKGLRYARAQTPHMRAYFYQKFLSCRQIAHHIWGNATAIATTIITRGTYQMQNSTLKIRAVISQNQIRLATIPKKLHKKRRPHILLPRARIPHIRLPRFHLHIATPILTFVLGALVVLLFVFVPYNLYLFFKFLPNPHLLSQRFIPVTTQIFDRNGSVLYEIHGDEDRKPIPLPEIPRFVKEATIAIEDKDFYHHPGFSISGIARAAKETFLHKQIQGGSTITQQLIKNSLLTPQISFVRKAREIFLAFWAERLYSKDQILEMYLNQVPYGGTSWGIEAACQRYFGKSVKAVTLAEAAFLAGLPAAPSLYSPYGIRPDLGRIRQHEVLRRMVEDHYITQNEQTAAEEIALNVKSDTTDIKAPHFVMYVRQLLEKKYGERLVDLGGLRITTTLDLQLQEKVQEKVTKNIADLKPLRVGNGAALITNPKNGDILAMVGSKDYFNQADDGNVNVTLAPRQPGSSIKVVTYAAALEHGLTAASTIDDTPIAFSVAGQPTYAPVNYDGRFHGTVTLRSALANSYNVPAVKILNRIGLSTMLEMGNRLGITTWTDSSRFGLSLTLGGGEVTMLDMATVYGTLANQGMRVDLDPILEISDYSGKVYYQKDKPNQKKSLKQRNRLYSFRYFS